MIEYINTAEKIKNKIPITTAKGMLFERLYPHMNDAIEEIRTIIIKSVTLANERVFTGLSDVCNVKF